VVTLVKWALALAAALFGFIWFLHGTGTIGSIPDWMPPGSVMLLAAWAVLVMATGLR